MNVTLLNVLNVTKCTCENAITVERDFVLVIFKQNSMIAQTLIRKQQSKNGLLVNRQDLGLDQKHRTKTRLTI